MIANTDIAKSMEIQLGTLFAELPPMPNFVAGIRRAPTRHFNLSPKDTELALKNALRYIPEKWHPRLAPEFLEELTTRGRIYGYRFRPAGPIKGRPVDDYEGRCIEGKAFQVMIENNLDFEVALYPYELVTYGETGQVCQNWMQYRLIKRYLEVLTREQTLVMASGHPVGLFASSPEAPRVIITNALMVGCFDDQDNWHRAMALGVANYGQMTAGGWMYIGPQGIVHGTYSTILNAGRAKLGIPADQDLAGRLFVTSGLGGMSGAQGKAVVIANGVSIIAEVDYSRIKTRLDQGWIDQVTDNPAEAFGAARDYQRKRQSRAIAFYGNVVDLLEYAVHQDIKIDLLSDQTSCHAVYEGGYCPQGISFEQRTELLRSGHAGFKEMVDATLRHHYTLIKTLSERGTYFFDYGNSFLKAVYDAGIKDICKNGENPLDGFIFQSYVEDILGPILFDYGYGPFRWVCLSGRDEDLAKTDQAAMAVHRPRATLPGPRQLQLDPRCIKEPAGGRHQGPDPLPGCVGADENRPEVQRDGARRRDRAGHARPRPPRHRRHGLAFPGDGQHPRRQQHHGRHGHPLLCRQRRPGHEPGGTPQRRRGGHRQGHQRRFRAGAGRKPTGRHDHPPRHPLGRDGRGRPPRLGPQRSLPRNLHGVQRAAKRLGPHHAAVSGR